MFKQHSIFNCLQFVFETVFGNIPSDILKLLQFSGQDPSDFFFFFPYNLSYLPYTHITHKSPEQGEGGTGLWLKRVVLRFWSKYKRDCWLEKLPQLNLDQGTVHSLAPSGPVKRGNNQDLYLVSYLTINGTDRSKSP